MKFNSISEKRYEFKFMLSLSEYKNFIIAYKSYLNIQKKYTVTSLYFDKSQLNFFYQNYNGELIKNKVRLRFYNNQLDSLFFEKKIKNGILNEKQRIPILAKNINEIDQFVQINQLFPECFVEFYRTEFVSNELPISKLRVTFDTDLKHSKCKKDKIENLLKNYKSINFHKFDNLYLIELKIDENINYNNLIIYNLLRKYKTSFSKYGVSLKNIYHI